jgi:hypothetical protein
MQLYFFCCHMAPHVTCCASTATANYTMATHFAVTCMADKCATCCCRLSLLPLLQLDAQQTYKQALAFWATGNVTYAENALRITHAWASNNQVHCCRRGCCFIGCGAAATKYSCKQTHLPGLSQLATAKFCPAHVYTTIVGLAMLPCCSLSMLSARQAHACEFQSNVLLHLSCCSSMDLPLVDLSCFDHMLTNN